MRYSNAIIMEEDDIDREGLNDDQEQVLLDIPDDDLLRIVATRVRASKKYWEQDKNLKARRELLRNYWQGTHRQPDFYDYQLPGYVDNRVYLQTEHIVQISNARLPDAIVESRSKDEEKVALAKEFGRVLRGYAETHRWRDFGRSATRDLLLAFQGILKIYWDDNAGPLDKDSGIPLGDVVIRPVLPENIVVDKSAKPYENPYLIAELIVEPLANIIDRFPKKKQAILDLLNIRGVKTQLGNTYGYWEVHFSYLGKNGEPKEGVVAFSENLRLVLAKGETPYWDTEGTVTAAGETILHNLLDRPGKGYSFLALSAGKLFIDTTTPIEQMIPLQDILNQRGQQIKDNAEMNRGGMFFNIRAITRDEAAEVTGDPFSSAMVKGSPTTAAARIAPALLPQYVLEDKYDARSEMDNIVGVHSPTRGEREAADQPTTVQLLKESDFQRRSDLIAGIDRMYDYAYRFAAHLMVLKYTDQHWKALGASFTTEQIRGADIDQVGVRAGTSLPTDQVTMREEAIKLAELDKIDYVTFFERLGFADPKEQARKLWLHLSNPAALYESEGGEAMAAQDIERLKRGEMPELPDTVDEEYLNAIIMFQKSPDFASLTPDIQALVAQYLQQIAQMARTQAPEPTPEEMAAAAPEAGGAKPPATGMLGRIGRSVRNIVR